MRNSNSVEHVHPSRLPQPGNNQSAHPPQPAPVQPGPPHYRIIQTILIAALLLIPQTAWTQTNPASFAINLATGVVTEGGTLSFRVSNTGGAPTGNVVATCTSEAAPTLTGIISASANDLLADADADATMPASTFPSVVLTFTPANHSTAQLCDFPTFDDTIVEPSESLRVSLTVSGGGASLLSGGEDTTGTINDNDMDTAPSFGTQMIDNQTFTATTAIATLRLPSATAGNGNLTHTLTGGIPAGLTFNQAMLTLTGTPTTPDPVVTLTYTAADSDANTAASDETSLTFTVTIAASDMPMPMPMPAPGVTLSATALTVTEGDFTTYTVVLDTLPDGDVMVTPTFPSQLSTSTTSLTFSTATWNTRQTVTITAAQDMDGANETVIITHSVSGYGSVTASDITVVVNDDDRGFGGAMVGDLIYGAGTAIPPQRLPEAISGDSRLVYTLTGDALPVGLTVDLATRLLSGTPAAVTSRSTHTWTATDRGAETGSLVFTIEIQMTSVCARTPQVRDAIVGAIPAVADCRHVTPTHLSRITRLDFERRLRNTPPRSGDFAGLSGLENLGLTFNFFTTLPENLFNGLSALRVLDLGENDFLTLPENLFAGLSALERIRLAATFLSSLPAGIFSGLGELKNLNLINSNLASLPAGIFSGLEALERLDLRSNQLPTLPAGIFSGLDSLDELYLSGNQFSQLPEGMFDGISGPLGNTLWLHNQRSNQVDPLMLSVDLEQRGDGRVRAWVREAAPLDIEVDWMVPGGGTGTIVIPQGRRTSDEFGTAMDSPATITLSNPRLRGVTEATHDAGGDYTGFQLVIASAPRPGVVFHPARLIVSENSTVAYTVVLNTAPTGTVTMTSNVTPSDNDVSLSPGALIFTVANWHRAQSVIVTAATDADRADDTATITYTVSGYNGVTAAALAVTVADADDRRPEFFAVAIASQTYTAGAVIPTLTLPEAIGGDGDLVYRLNRRDLPAGLRYTPRTRTLSGVPTTVGPAVTLTWTVMDTDSNRLPDDTDSLIFTVTVIDAEAGVTIVPTDLTVNEGAETTYDVVLAAAPEGSVTITLTVNGPVTHTPAALTFETTDWNISQRVTITASTDPDSADATATITHTVSGYGAITTAAPVTITVFDIRAVPSFGGAMVGDLVYATGAAIRPLRLPGAIGGDGRLSYALAGTIPSGLTFDLATHLLSGTPDGVASQSTYTWTATDRDADTASLVFTIAIQNTDVCGRTAAVRDAIVAAISSASNCVDVVPASFGEITELRLNGQGIDAFRVGDFDGLVAVTVMDLGINAVNALPSGLFNGLDALEVLFMGLNPFPSLPGDIFNGLSNLRELSLGNGQLRTLPEGLFQGLGPLELLYLTQNPPGPSVFDLNVYLVPFDGGWVVEVREATPLTIQVTVRFSTFGDTVMARIDAGTRETSRFTGQGDPQITGAVFEFPGGGTPTTDDTNVNDGYTGFRLVTRSTPPGVTLAPTAITIPEGEAATYTVVLNAAPTADVTVTPTVVPAGNIVTISPAPVFTPANWNRPRTVTVTVPDNGDAGDASVTITLTASGSGYGAITAGQVVVTVLDDDADIPPIFDVTTVAPQIYGRDAAIPPLTLPAARRGNEPVTYALTGALPSGLAVDRGRRTLSGTPTALASASTYTWTATDSDGDTASVTFTIEVQMTSVCGRTPYVRDALVMAIDGVTDCADVTMAHLSRIRELEFTGAHGGSGFGLVTALRSGDFDGLSGLVDLVLDEGLFTALPEDLFNGLDALESLSINDAEVLRTLPEGIFRGLGALRTLFLQSHRGLNNLPAGLFSGLRSLTSLNMSSNDSLTELPAGLFSGLDSLESLLLHSNRQLSTLPAGLFSGLDSLQSVLLQRNALSALPEGLFDGVSGPLSNFLTLADNPGAPFTLFVDLEQRGDGRVRARVREAAPLDIEVDWMVSGMAGPTRTILIPQGRRTSDEFGMPMISPASITLSTPRFRDVTERTDDTSGDYAGFQLAIASMPRPSVVFDPPRITMFENTTRVYTVVLNTAPAGNVTITASVSPSDADIILSPNTLIFTRANWHLAQSVTVAAAVDPDTTDDTATITYAVSGYGDITTATVPVVVTDPRSAPAFPVATVADQTYATRVLIPTLTLPEATAGDGALRYTLTGLIPAGLRFDADTRTLAGIPTAGTAAVTLTYTVTDEDGDTSAGDMATLTVAITITAAMPGVAIDPTDLPIDEGAMATYVVLLATAPAGDVTVTPALDSPLPPGEGQGEAITISGAVTFSPADWSEARTVTVRAPIDPDNVSDTVTLTHTVSGYGGVTTAPTVTVTVRDIDSAPTFDSAMVPDQTYLQGDGIPTLTLPAATAGDGPLRYTLTDLPAGLTFSEATLTLAGTPTIAGDSTLTYTVTDRDTNTATEDSASLTFELTVRAPRVTINPTSLTVNEGTTTVTITYTAVLGVPPNGNVIITPASDHAAATVAGALTFSPTTWSMTQTVTVSVASDTDPDDATVTITHTVSGYGSATTAAAVTVTVTDTGSVPSFGEARVGNLFYIPNAAIPPLTLPEAIGGDGTVSHTLTGTLPTGLAFDSGTRVLSGTPTALTAVRTYTWTATESRDGDSSSLVFTIAVHPTNICGRHPLARNAILAALSTTDCTTVTMAQLGGITMLGTPGISTPADFAERRRRTLGPGDYAGLTSVTSLYLNRLSLRALPSGVFEGLDSLETLNLAENFTDSFTSLPVDIFRGLGNLRVLNMGATSLTSLPVGIFSGLNNLQELDLQGGATSSVLTSLPVGIFRGLSLVRLHLNGNILPGLPEGLFEGLGPFRQLHLGRRDAPSADQRVFTLNVVPAPLGDGRVQAVIREAAPMNVEVTWAVDGRTGTATIPAGQRGSGAFPGVTAADAVQLSSARFVFPAGVSAERTDEPGVGVNTGDYTGFRLATPPVPSWARAVSIDPTALVITEHAPATYTMVLNAAPERPVTVTPAVTPGGSQVTVSAAVVFTPMTWRSPQTVTVAAAADASAVTATITHTISVEGYGDVAMADPVIVQVSPPVCDRTPQVRDAIVTAIDGVEDCGDVTLAHLGRVTALRFLDDSFEGTLRGATLQSGDFAGLTALRSLNLQNNQLTTLPDGIFNGLTALRTLNLSFNSFTTLPENLFNGLTALDQLLLGSMRSLRSVPAGLFSGLGALRVLQMEETGLTMLPGGLFSGLDRLQWLRLENMGLTTLPGGFFSGLDTLDLLFLDRNQLRQLPEGMFDGIGGPLRFLSMGENPGAPFTLFVDLEQGGDGRVRARVREAAPLDIEVDWMVSGMAGPSTVLIPQGRRTSDEFGMPMTSPASITLSNARFRGVTEPTDDDFLTSDDPGDYSGFRVDVASASRAGIVFNPARLTVPEGDSATYTVVLNTAPTGDVTVTPSISPSSSGLSLSPGSLTFTIANWHQAQTTTVTADEDEGDTDDTATITHMVDGYSDVTTAALVVTVDDDDDLHPTFGTSTIPPQTYNANAPIPTLTFPEATGGDGDLVYSLNHRDLPAGLVYSERTRTLSGIPTGPPETVTLIWTVMDSDDNRTPDDEAALTFTITVTAAVPGVVLPRTVLTVAEGAETTYTVVLATEPGGDVTVTPTVSPLPPGEGEGVTVSGALTFSTANWDTAQAITVTGVIDDDNTADPATITHTVAGYGDVDTAAEVVVTVTDTRSVPSFGATTVGDLIYAAREAIRPQTLPAATGGDGTVVYTLTGALPDGLTLDTATRILSGTPAAITPVRTYIWTATDSETDTGRLVFTIEVGTTSVCGRTPEVRDVIVAAIDGVEDCEDVTIEELREITELNFFYVQPGDSSVTRPLLSGTVRSGDFDGLSGLVRLILWRNGLTTLPAGIFNGLSALQELNVAFNRLTTLPAGIFNGLSALNRLNMSGNNLLTLPAGIFNDLSALEVLALGGGTAVPAGFAEGLPAGVFDDLSALRRLHLNFSLLSELPAGIFNGLTSLEQLFLDDNRQLRVLPAGLLSGLDALEIVQVHNSDVMSLPAGLFDGTSSGRLREIFLSGNPGSPFTLSVELEQQGDGRARARVREAAPIPIEVTWASPGTAGGTVVIPMGQRTSAPFGSPMSTLADITLSSPRFQFPEFPGVAADTNTADSSGRYAGFQLGIASAPSPGVIFNPARLAVREGDAATYTVVLGAAPTSNVTLVPRIGPAGSDIRLLQGGLIFTAANWHRAQTVSITTSVDADGDTDIDTIYYLVDGYPGVTEVALEVTVIDRNDQQPDFGTRTIPDQIYTARAVIPTLTLPEAAGGDGTLVYRLIRPEFPAGLRYTASTRTLSGVPTSMRTAVTLTWAVVDSDNNRSPEDAAFLTFTITVAAAVAGVTIPQQSLTVDEGAETTYTVVLAAVPAGDVTVTPAVSGPAGTITVSGALTFGTSNWGTAQIITVTAGEDDDAADDTAIITHTVGGYGTVTSVDSVTVVVTDRLSVPTFNEVRVPDQVYTVGMAIPVLTLPAAINGRPRLTYTLTDDGGDPIQTVLPGLTFDPTTRTLFGTPTMSTLGDTGLDQQVLTWTAIDRDGRMTSVQFAISVAGLPAVLIEPSSLTMDEGATATYTVHLAAMPDGGRTVALTPTVTPAGRLTGAGTLAFDGTNWARRQTVTIMATADADGPGASHDTITIGYGVSGYGGVMAPDLLVTILEPPNAPDFGGVVVEDQTYTARAVIPPLTLPAAAGGDDVLNYTLTGALPPGLSFDARTRTLTGIPTDMAMAVTLTYTVIDGDDDQRPADSATLIFPVTIAAAVDGVTIPRTVLDVLEGDSVTYTVVLATAPDGEVIVTPTLDSGVTAVTISSALTFSITNWNTAQIVRVNAVEEDTDTNDDMVTIRHTVSGYRAVTEAAAVTVTAVDNDSAPAFDSAAMVPSQVYVQGSAIPVLTLPAATGGARPLSYTLSGNVVAVESCFDSSRLVCSGGVGTIFPRGLTFDSATRTLFGTPPTSLPTAAFYRYASPFTMTYTVSDADEDTGSDDEDTLTFTLEVQTDAMPSFDAAAVPHQIYTVGASVSLTLPAAADGNAPLDYAVSGLPDGLTFDPAMRILSGVLMARGDDPLMHHTLTYTVRDRDRDAASLTFVVTGVAGAGVLLYPFDVALDEATMGTYTVQLTTDPGGDVTVMPVAPAGTDLTVSGALTFRQAAWNTVQTVTISAGVDPDQDDATVTVTHTVTGYGDVTADAVTVTIRDVDSLPIFVESTVADQTYRLNAAITPLTLPAATGGDGDLVYALRGDLPDGLEIDLDTRTLTGAPTGVMTVTLTWTATDDDDDTAALIFTVTVTGQVTIEPVTLTLTEGSMTTYTVVLNRIPAGDVTVTPVSGNADVLTVSDPLIFRPATWNAPQTVTVVTLGDADTADDRVTITHMVGGFGDAAAAAVTVTITDTGAVLPISLETTALTVDEGDTVTYTVVLDRAPAGDATVTPLPDASAVTVSDALTFSATTWNREQTVTVVAVQVDADVTVTITHRLAGYGAVAEGSALTVAVIDGAPTFGTAMVAPQAYVINSAITPLVLPEATRGEGELSYALMGMLPDGLTYTDADRTLRGTPTGVSAPVTLTWTATDEADESGHLTFPVVVTVPGFIFQPAFLNPLEDDPARPLTLEEGDTTNFSVTLSSPPVLPVTVLMSVSATGGAVTLRPAALTFTSSNYFDVREHLVDVTAVEDLDNLPGTATISFTFRIGGDTFPSPATIAVRVNDPERAPSFGEQRIDDQIYRAGMSIPTLTLPRAESGDGALTHTLTGALPAGLTFDADRFTLTGMPTTAAPGVTLTWTAVDSDDNLAPTDRAVLAFVVTVTPPSGVTLSTPSLTIDETDTTNTATYTVVLTTMPTGTVTVTPTPEAVATGPLTVSGALTFTPATWSTHQTVTVTVLHDTDRADATVPIRHAVTGYDDVTTAPDLIVQIIDDENLRPAFGAMTVVDQTYTTDTAITLTLPPATGGDGTLRYTLTGTLPDGLAYTDTGTARTITGTPATVGVQVTLTYTAMDVDDDPTSLTFTVTVSGVIFSSARLPFREDGQISYAVELSAHPGVDVVIIPSVSPAGVLTISPAALTFTAANYESPQQFTLTPVEDADFDDERATIRHTVRAGGGVPLPSPHVIAVELLDEDLVPTFGRQTVADQIYNVGSAIRTLTLPAGDGGNGELSYMLNGPLPDGLTHTDIDTDTGTRHTLTGTPTAVAAAVTLTWTVADADINTGADDTATLTFTVTVNEAYRIAIAPTALTVDESATGIYTVVLAAVPTGAVTVTPTPDVADTVALPGALTFSVATWNAVQTVTITALPDADTDTEVVTITHEVAGLGDDLAPAVMVTVRDTNGVPGFGLVAVPDQVYFVNMPIPPLDLPGAAGGNGVLTYTLTGGIPAGLTYTTTPVSRTLTGTPTAVTPAVTLTYTVTDADTNTAPEDVDILTFTVMVAEAPVLTFVPSAIAMNEGETDIYEVTLVTAPTGNVTVVPMSEATDKVALTGALTFSAATWNVAQTVTVTALPDDDTDEDTATITHAITGAEGNFAPPVIVTITDTNGVPGFVVDEIDDQVYTMNMAVPPLTLPEAMGGNDDLTYTLAGDLPAGLTYTDATRTLTGTPGAVTAAVTLTYTVTDSDTNMSPDDTATLIFTVTVEGAAPGVTVDPTALTVEEGRTDIYTVVLTAAPEGTVTVMLTLSGPVTHSPAALTFVPAAWQTLQTVTVTAATDADTADASATITHAVSGYGSVRVADPVTIVIDDTRSEPTFGSATVPDQTYTVNALITPLTLPVATAGDGIVNFALTGAIPPGLDFDAVARTLSGVPTTAAPAVTLTWTATDEDNDEATLTFTVTVEAAEPGVTLRPVALTVDEGAMTVYTVRLATAPDGDVTVMPMPMPTGPITHTPAALTFDTATWSMEQTVTVTAAEVDDADTADDTVTITHTVTGYGSVTEGGTVTVVVADTNGVPGFVVDGIADQVYTVDVAIPPLTLPEATGGDDGLTYTLTGGLPAGLTYTSGAINTLTGTPTAVTAAVTLTYTVTDGDTNVSPDDMATLPFTVMVEGSAPGVTLNPVALTVDEGGMAVYTVWLATEPDGDVTVTPVTDAGRVVAVAGELTFGPATWSTLQTVTVTAMSDPDTADDTAIITHTVVGYGSLTEGGEVTVTVTDTNGVPAFVVDEIADQVYTVDVAISPLELPAATGGDDGLTYTLTGALPVGLTYTEATRTLIGTPMAVASAVTLTWTVADRDTNMDADDAATLPFTVAVAAAAPGVTLPATLAVDENAVITYTVVLATRPGGDVTVTPVTDTGGVVAVTGALTFSTATWSMEQTVTVSAAADADVADDTVTITHTVVGYGSVTQGGAVTVTVADTNGVPAFVVGRVADQVYPVGEAISALVLPAATGGDDALIYTLTGDLPAGLTYTEATRTLIGIPTAVAPAVTLTYRVVDSDTNVALSDADTLTFTVTIAVDDLDIRAGLANLNRVVLPEVTRALADQRIGAISRRIQQARAGAAGGDGGGGGSSARGLTIGGQSTLAGMVATHGKTIAGGNFDLKTILGGSDFVLPLNARGLGLGALSGVTLWGSGDYRGLSGKSSALDWDGKLFNGHIGADMRVSKDVLAGVAVSWGQVDVDYNDATDERIGLRGDYDVDIATVHPYVGWTAFGGRLDLWATAGYGWGELEIQSADQRVGRSASDVTMQTIGAGGSGQLLERGGTTVRLKGEALHTSMDVDGGDRIVALMVEARRARLGVEFAHTHQLMGGGQIVPSVEIGMRHDAGDGRTGTGAEVGGGFRYVDAARGLTVESRGRVLLGHTGDYDDWGLGGSIKFESGGGGGRGLSVSLRPTWGAVASRVDQVWSQAAAVTVPAAGGGGAPVQRNGQMDLDVGYGLGWGEEVLVVPYGRLTVTNSPARTWRVGSRMSVGSGMTLNVEGVREETAARLVNQGVRLSFGLGLSNGMRLNVEGLRQQNAAEALNHGIKLQLGVDF